MPWKARIAYIIAFVVAGLNIAVALTTQIVLLPFAFIPLIAGIGILRRRVWSAYGFALFQFVQLLLLPLLVFRSGTLTARLPEVLGTAALAVVLIPLFFFAGRSLAAAGAPRGWAFPWIAISALVTPPLFFVQPFVIPSSGMDPTILIGDRILVQLFPGFRPARGDIIVFVYPVDRRETYVKRLIGVPGDRIRISEKIVYRNGAALKEPYAVHKSNYADSYRDNFPSELDNPFASGAREMLEKHVVNGEVVVPAGKYFVLGDNRDKSLDSRYWGFVDSGDLIGKPLLIYDSGDQPTDALVNGTPGGPRRVRWNRILKML